MTVALATLCTIAAALASACRYRFDELAGDASLEDGLNDGVTTMPLDATQQLLECDIGVKLLDVAAATAPGLTAAATPSGIVAAWLTDAGRVGAVVVDLPVVDSAVAVRASRDLLGTATGTTATVGIAATTQTILVVARATSEAGGFTTFSSFDVGLTGETTARGIALGQADPEAVTALPSTLDFAQAAPSNGDLTAVARLVVGDTTFSDDIQGQGAHVRRALVGLDQRVVLTAATTSDSCEGRVVDLAAGTSGAAQSWGASPCASAHAAAVPGTDELMVARDGGSSIRLALATASGLSLSVGSELSTMYTGIEPRLTATSAGYWIARNSSGILFVDHRDRSGTSVGSVRSPGDVPTATGHDIVSRGAAPYAIWLDNGLWVARMCP